VRLKLTLPLVVLAIGVAATSASAARSLRTAIVPNEGLDNVNDNRMYARIKAAGAWAVRINLNWAAVAPRTVPSGFDPTDPADTAYSWKAVDREVRNAAAHDLVPILTVFNAPTWAQAEIPPDVYHTDRDGPYKPNPTKFGRFAQAAAKRYTGTFVTNKGTALPRVRYWIAWNEPNIYRYLTPVNVNGKPFSPEWYQRMVNSFANAVHGVRGDNLVVAGALAPFGIDRRISPLTFMREMLCMSTGKTPHATCGRKASFDIWSHHPYTRGDPFHHAMSPNDVSLGDLPEMRRLLEATVRAGHVSSGRKVQFWVDEISYDSHPPDRSRYVPDLALHARYVAETLYQTWRSGVSLTAWFLLRDEPLSSPNQSGLYLIDPKDPGNLLKDRPKPALTAFRFPFVAYKKGNKVSVWGRTPDSTGGSISIDARLRSGWRRIGGVSAGGNGVFQGNVSFAPIARGAKNPAAALVRARFGSAKSLGFSLKRPPDRFILPFG
jgi:hypothetical protein